MNKRIVEMLCGVTIHIIDRGQLQVSSFQLTPVQHTDNNIVEEVLHPKKTLYLHLDSQPWFDNNQIGSVNLQVAQWCGLLHRQAKIQKFLFKAGQFLTLSSWESDASFVTFDVQFLITILYPVWYLGTRINRKTEHWELFVLLHFPLHSPDSAVSVSLSS